MTPLATGFLQDQDFIRSCYIVAFILFIQGLRMLRTPVSARRGNVVGGFLVTDRMLEMFRARPKPQPKDGDEPQ